MAVNVPMPGMPGQALMEGLNTGSGLFQKIMQQKQKQAQLGYQQQRMEQDWQTHMENAAIRQAQEQRLMQELGMKNEAHPLNLDLLRAKIESERQRPSSSANQSMKENPQDKRNNAFEEFKRREEFKASKKPASDLSNPVRATIANNQSVIAASNNIIPQIEQLKGMKIPSQLANVSPNDQQAYLGLSNSIADGLMTAFSLPRTDQSLHMVKQMVQRGKLESQDAYKDRLGGIVKELESRRNNANQILTESNVAPKQEMGRMIQIRNKKTGETETVSEEVARQRGALK